MGLFEKLFTPLFCATAAFLLFMDMEGWAKWGLLALAVFCLYSFLEELLGR